VNKQVLLGSLIHYHYIVLFIPAALGICSCIHPTPNTCPASRNQIPAPIRKTTHKQDGSDPRTQDRSDKMSWGFRTECAAYIFFKYQKTSLKDKFFRSLGLDKRALLPLPQNGRMGRVKHKATFPQ
jgi:hypothetical protein